MKITRRHPFTGKENTFDLPVSQAQLDRWQRGEVIQRAMPELSPDQREFLISGIPPGEFDQALAHPVPMDVFNEYENEPGHLTAFASDCGLRPGEWPETVKFEDGRVFERGRPIGTFGELLGYKYTDHDGEFHLTIFND